MRKKSNNRFIIFGIVVIIILAIIAFATRKKEKVIDYSKMTDEEVSVAIQEKVNDINKKNLSELDERDRMEYYVSSFVKAIENKQYEDAYEMLYDDFKTNYFPTLASFEEYAKTKLPKTISLNNTNIERNGDVYVLWVTMYNPLGSKDSGKEINFVVRENDLNDFDLSFSVI